MKNILPITILLCLFLFLLPEKEKNAVSVIDEETEATIKENTDFEQNLQILISDFQSSNCLTARRHVQTSQFVFNNRSIKTAIRVLQEIRLKKANQLRKISEQVSISQTSNLSSLLCRWGSHIYLLRKIVI